MHLSSLETSCFTICRYKYDVSGMALTSEILGKDKESSQLSIHRTSFQYLSSVFGLAYCFLCEILMRKKETFASGEKTS